MDPRYACIGSKISTLAPVLIARPRLFGKSHS